MTYIKYKSGGNSSRSALGRVIDYCLQPHKTQIGEKAFCTSGEDCVPAYALDQFMATKQAWGKCGGTYFYHYVQSFSPDEAVTPQEVNEIGLEFAARAWPGHEVLVATHVDREHLHNHFVINSVNHETGLKLRQTPKTLQTLRQLSDGICAAHGLSVLKPYARKPDVRDVKNGEYRSAVRSDSWKFRLRSAITMSMETSWTPDQFRVRMREFGYETVWRADRKHITYVCLNEPPHRDGKQKRCRDRSLSDTKYLKEVMEVEFAIRKRILEEIEHGRTDTDEHADPAFNVAGRGAQTVGIDERGADGNAPGAFEGDRGAEIFAGSAAGGAVTGWEVSREKLCGADDGRSAVRRDEEHEVGRERVAEADGDVWMDHLPRYVDLLAGLFPRPSLKGKTHEEVQRELDAEREAKNVGAALGIPLAVIAYLIERARADELDEARERFGIARADSVSHVQGSEGQDADDLFKDGTDGRSSDDSEMEDLGEDGYEYDDREEVTDASDLFDGEDDKPKKEVPDMEDLGEDGYEYYYGETEYGGADSDSDYDPKDKQNNDQDEDDDEEQYSGPTLS
ncbi:MAG: relaxase/mobilization nuclease domain-containing protein [Clostridia bacterium]|nr:relaxase/mobilization nuclease domain-containing protein [Clostridia bacterium]